MRLLHGNCLDLLDAIPDSSVDMVLMTGPRGSLISAGTTWISAVLRNSCA
ncbi:MAG: hypothetical protein HFH54_01745 [Lachnospiraceae bacterium]|nr:hypothetical protein [Lachnospiraceae bacterium]